MYGRCDCTLILGCFYLPAKHDVEVVRRLSLSVYVLPPVVAVVRHAIRERPDFRMGPVCRQAERVLEKVDLHGVHRECINQRACCQWRNLSPFQGGDKSS